VYVSNGRSKMVLFGGSFTEKHWIFLALEKCTRSQCPARALVATRSDLFLSNKWLFLRWPTTTIVWPRCWELNSLWLCTVHLFTFMGGDGGETKQCTLNVLSTDRAPTPPSPPPLALICGTL
jgi:hypothetical protein